MAATYDIVSQVPRTRIDPGGTPTQTVLITFKTKPSGQVGQVDVPASMYTIDEVDRLATVKAALIEAVQAL